MLTTLDLYLATSSALATQMDVRATVGIGAFIWGGGDLVDHVLVARVASLSDR